MAIIKWGKRIMKWKVNGLIRHTNSGTPYVEIDYVYYIVKEVDRKNEQPAYLHRDGTIHQYCGDNGFYKTELDAYKMLDIYKKIDKLLDVYKMIDNNFLPDVLFEI